MQAAGALPCKQTIIAHRVDDRSSTEQRTTTGTLRQTSVVSSISHVACDVCSPVLDLAIDDHGLVRTEVLEGGDV